MSGLKCCIRKDDTEQYLHFLNYSSEKVAIADAGDDTKHMVSQIMEEVTDFKTSMQQQVEDIKIKQA